MQFDAGYFCILVEPLYGGLGGAAALCMFSWHQQECCQIEMVYMFT